MGEEFIVKAALYVVPLLLAVVCHEVAHGWVAEKLGDHTARLSGRITLNPFVHIDLIGTVLLPAILILTKSPFLFGWAKPVPVNFGNLRRGRRDMALVAASGPMTNLVLAGASAVVYRLIVLGLSGGVIPQTGWAPWIVVPLAQMAGISVEFNLVLTVLNLLPIPPLDGGRILVGLLPESLAYRLARLERFGMLILVVLIATGSWSQIVRPVLKAFVDLFLG
ncbi:site-2 protease family protein [Syntrophobacter fumaroxidans]|uniref:Peptidase M50 n=1 Tax=Syntrophobacter fumaroxidans (strain DSM 10017 / MPOB) TaxID=335543 RepID=A0LG28_SYNFM|nr:site-2 protease family protein [Syntrophobacter fumaroxidans]ABK16380.1 peptidase M50 [Syntrophobacter fumaroxidans MPOB]